MCKRNLRDRGTEREGERESERERENIERVRGDKGS